VKRLLGVRPELLGLAAVGGVVLIGLPTLTNQFFTFEFAKVAIFVCALLGLNLLTGYSGQISLGNGAFMAVGGYTTAILVHATGVPYWLTIPLAAVVAGAAGLLIGIPALRLSGVYLALATFALALSIPPILNHFDTFTGGHGGIVMPPVMAPFGLDLSQEQWLYYLCTGIAILLFAFAWGVVRSRTGRAFMAIRDSETAATASGVSLAYYKTLAFGLSAAYAGVAGSLLAIVTSFINPDSFGLGLSLTLLVGVVIGGLGLNFGAVPGGLLVVWLPYFAEKAGEAGLHIGSLSFAGKPDIFFGAALILIMLFAPNGAAGLLVRGWRWYLSFRTATRLPVAGPVAGK
jgi:branched-chain amino acid transport system permease protein